MSRNLIRIADRRSARAFAVEHPHASVLGVGEEDPRSWPGDGRRVWIPLVDGEGIDPTEFWRAVFLLNEMARQPP